MISCSSLPETIVAAITNHIFMCVVDAEVIYLLPF